MKKFELTDQTITLHNNKILYRIRACKSFNDVKEGDFGGYVESEHNLSQSGNAWIYGNACVHQNAYVFGNACLYDNAEAFGNARIYDNARLYDFVEISETAIVRGYATLYNKARISGSAIIEGHAQISDQVKIYGFACVKGFAKVLNRAEVFGNAQVAGNAYIFNQAFVRYNDSISGEGYIANWLSLITFKDFEDKDSSAYYLLPYPFTFFKDCQNNICVNCKDYTGTFEDFQKQINAISEDCIKIKYLKLIDIVKDFFHKAK